MLRMRAGSGHVSDETGSVVVALERAVHLPALPVLDVRPGISGLRSRLEESGHARMRAASFFRPMTQSILRVLDVADRRSLRRHRRHAALAAASTSSAALPASASGRTSALAPAEHAAAHLRGVGRVGGEALVDHLLLLLHLLILHVGGVLLRVV